MSCAGTAPCRQKIIFTEHCEFGHHGGNSPWEPESIVIAPKYDSVCELGMIGYDSGDKSEEFIPRNVHWLARYTSAGIRDTVHVIC
jgi:hypothetical protein